MNIYDLIRERGKLLSAWDLWSFMKQFDAHAILSMQHVCDILTSGGDIHEALLKQEDVSWQRLRDACEAAEFTLSVITIDKIGAALNDPEISSEAMNKLVQTSFWPELQGRMNDELRSSLLYCVDKQHAHIFQQPLLGWEDVLDQWPDAVNDVESAGRCLALSLPTACVFHLSRIAERGLREACEKYIPEGDLPPSAHGTMGKYLECADKFANVSPPKPQGAIELSEAATHFARIKYIWRDNVSHIGIDYSVEHASTCYHAIKDMLTACAKLV